MYRNNSMTRALRRSARRGAVVLGAAALGVGAVAAPASAGHYDWTGVAQCESGGRWNVDTGNGYYGGLQFSAPTWLGHGGGEFAPRADLASPAQQVAVAERVLLSQGAGAWPTCGKQLRPGTTAAAPAPAPAAPAPAAAPATVPAAPGSYVVQGGDTLARIAQAKGIDGGWRALWAINRDTVGNPNEIRIGQTIAL